MTTSALPGGSGSRMIGSPHRPMSPENTTRSVIPFSVQSSTTDAEPRMWPASTYDARTPGTTSNSRRYGTPTISSATFAASRTA